MPPIKPCTILAPGACATDFTTFWILALSAVAIPGILMFFFFLMPGPAVVKAFLRARITGAPILFKVRKDTRADIVSGNYEGGLLVSKKHGAFIPTSDSFFTLPGGFKFGIANENYGVTLPPQLVKDIQVLKRYGYRTLDEVQKAIDDKEREMKALKNDPEAYKGMDRRTKDKLAEAVKSLMDRGDYGKVLKQKVAEHQEMFLPFARIQNFFKSEVRSTGVITAVERIVSENLQNQRKIDVNKILMILLIGGFFIIFAIIILSSVDLGGLMGGGGGASNPIGQGIKETAQAQAQGGQVVK